LIKKAYLKFGFSNGVLFAVNKFTPFIIIPILTSRLGISGFGKLSLLTSLTLMMNQLIVFGLGEKSITSFDKEGSFFLSNFINFKILMSLIITPIYFLFFFVYGFELRYFLIGFLGIVGFSINHEWYFSATLNLESIVKIKFLIKSFYLTLTYLLVNDSDDLGIAFLLFVLSELLISLIIFLKIKDTNKFILNLNFQNFLKTLRKGKVLFLSNFSSYILNNFILFFSGFIFSYQIIGIYSIASKVFNFLKDSFNPIINTFFPIIVKLKNDHIFKYLKAASFILYAILGLCIYLESNFIFGLFSNDDQYISLVKNLFLIFSIILPFNILNSIIAYELIYFSDEKVILIATFSSGIINTLLILISYFLDYNSIIYFVFINLISTIILTIILTLRINVRFLHFK